MTTQDHDDHEHAYTAYYCEENVYHLVEWLTAKGHFEQVFAVFVSNDMRQNLLYYQRAAAPGAQYVVWDYHVFAVTVDKCESGTAKGSEIGRDIALRGKTANACVWDLDTQLGLKVPLEEYVEETFRPGLYAPGGVIDTLMELQEPKVRVVTAQDLLANFASDRSHMLNEGTEEYCYPPPSANCIQSPNAVRENIKNNLWTRFLNMSAANGESCDKVEGDTASKGGGPYGKVYTLAEFHAGAFL